MNSIRLESGEVHVWYVRTDHTCTARLLTSCEKVLSADERDRWQRFAFENGRREYLVSHGFLRHVLSHYARMEPAGWRFVRNAYGKPEIAPARGMTTLRSLCFNLSHTNGLAACAITRDREIGVDVEDVQRRGREIGDELIRRCLSPVELESMQQLEAEQRKLAFFDYWTLKEAYLKARGFGLSLPVEGITFHWSSGTPHHGRVHVSFGPEISDHPHNWQFERLTPTTHHKLALAVRRPCEGTDSHVIVKEYHQLEGHH